MNAMNRKKYSFIMMDSEQFVKYKKMCERNNIPCNYNQINSDCYGVMIGEERLENNVELVEEVKEIIN